MPNQKFTMGGYSGAIGAGVASSGTLGTFSALDQLPIAYYIKRMLISFENTTGSALTLYFWLFISFIINGNQQWWTVRNRGSTPIISDYPPASSAAFLLVNHLPVNSMLKDYMIFFPNANNALSFIEIPMNVYVPAGGLFNVVLNWSTVIGTNAAVTDIWGSMIQLECVVA